MWRIRATPSEPRKMEFHGEKRRLPMPVPDGRGHTGPLSRLLRVVSAKITAIKRTAAIVPNLSRPYRNWIRHKAPMEGLSKPHSMGEDFITG